MGSHQEVDTWQYPLRLTSGFAFGPWDLSDRRHCSAATPTFKLTSLVVCSNTKIGILSSTQADCCIQNLTANFELKDDFTEPELDC